MEKFKQFLLLAWKCVVVKAWYEEATGTERWMGVGAISLGFLLLVIPNEAISSTPFVFFGAEITMNIFAWMMFISGSLQVYSSYNEKKCLCIFNRMVCLDVVIAAAGVVFWATLLWSTAIYDYRTGTGWHVAALNSYGVTTSIWIWVLLRAPYPNRLASKECNDQKKLLSKANGSGDSECRKLALT